MHFANQQQWAKKAHGMEAKKETCAEEKKASLGEALEKGIIIFLFCAVLNSPYRAVGTSSLWSPGRLTPNGGARNGTFILYKSIILILFSFSYYKIHNLIIDIIYYLGRYDKDINYKINII